MVKRIIVTDPDAEAKKLHKADKALSWLRWEQLSEGSRYEYQLEAAKISGKPLPRFRVKL